MSADKSGEKGADLVPPEHRVERAGGDFRRGMPVLIRSGASGGSAVAAAAETLTDATLSALKGAYGQPSAYLTHARAATLKIRLYTEDAVAIALRESVNAAELRAIADPASDLDNPMKGPFEAVRGTLPDSGRAAIQLAKLAGLLPAAVLFRVSDAERDRLAAAGVLAQAEASDILRFEETSAAALKLVVRARVPLQGAEDAELVAFRPANGGQEHYAVVIGGAGLAQPVLARLHSECFTGDLLGSLKCDCGDQLRGAIQAIAKAGGGVLLYLAQEGRGIGLMNKLRAYRLQDEGFDTMEANQRLGFAADERLYDIAARMLRELGFAKVRLMTNNPDKVRALQQAGIEVTERVPHAFPDNVHNRDYLKTKAEKGGHLL
jgi:GTP cyclohydrolase II